MLEHIHVERVLFIDIETVTQHPDYSLLKPEIKTLWDYKAGFIDKVQEPGEVYQNKGAIYAEFGKIICISIGYLKKENEVYTAKLKSFFHDEEHDLLSAFSDFILNLQSKKSSYIFGGHNIREFDIPYICRRMLLNGISLPEMLNIVGKKPWEVDIIDTLQFWKFGDYKNFTSLKLLCQIFEIKEVKEGMDGGDVGTEYWEHHNLEKIVKYCETDVLAVMKLLMKFKQIKELKIEKIEYGIGDS